MTELNRRKMLLGIAAASTAAATHEARAQTTQEAPELVALGNDLSLVHHRYKEANAAHVAIVARVMKNWPLAPEPILIFAAGSETECDVTGAGISRVVPERGVQAQVWRYGTPEVFRVQIKEAQAELARIRTFKRRHAHREAFLEARIAQAQVAIPLSRDYCKTIQHLKSGSGIEGATNRLEVARDALIAHIDAIMTAEPRTMEGVVIQAQALAVWGKVERFYRALTPKAVDWPQRIAGSVLRQADGSA